MGVPPFRSGAAHDKVMVASAFATARRLEGASAGILMVAIAVLPG